MIRYGVIGLLVACLHVSYLQRDKLEKQQEKAKKFIEATNRLLQQMSEENAQLKRLNKEMFEAGNKVEVRYSPY